MFPFHPFFFCEKRVIKGDIQAKGEEITIGGLAEEFHIAFPQFVLHPPKQSLVDLLDILVEGLLIRRCPILIDAVHHGLEIISFDGDKRAILHDHPNRRLLGTLFLFERCEDSVDRDIVGPHILVFLAEVSGSVYVQVGLGNLFRAINALNYCWSMLAIFLQYLVMWPP